jgi:hypothetical protein
MFEASGKRKLGWVAILLAVVTFLVAAGWWGRPAYRQHKEQRSLRQAQNFFATGDFRSGLLSLRQALALNATNVASVRMMADFATQTQSPAALGWWRRVVELSPTVENRSLLAAAALRVEAPPFPVAAQTIQELAVAGVTNVPFHLLASQLALKLNRGDDAEFHLAAAARLEPTNRMHQINLATLRLQAREPAVAAAARQELAGLTQDAQWGANVLRALIADALSRTNGAAAQQFSRQLLATTNATFADRLVDLSAAVLVNDPGLAARVQQLQTDSATNALLITQTALWLNQNQRAAETLAWFPRIDPKLRELTPLALVEAEAFVATRDWSGLELRLSGQKWDEQDFFRLAYLTRALREQGRATTAAANWDRAIGATLSRSERAGALVQLAFNWGWRAEGEALLWRLAKQVAREDWPLQNLLRIYTAEQNTAGLHRVHEELFLRHPRSLPIKNNLAMLGLLLRQDVPRATQLAREVHAVAGTNGIFTSTYALALHLEGRAPEGLQLLKNLSEAERTRPEVAPYAALLQAACGEQEAMRPILQQAARQAGLPEEKRLLESLTN